MECKYYLLMRALSIKWKYDSSSLTLPCHSPPPAAPSLLVDYVNISEHGGCTEVRKVLVLRPQQYCFYVAVAVLEHGGWVDHLQVIARKLNLLLLLLPLQREYEH